MRAMNLVLPAFAAALGVATVYSSASFKQQGVTRAIAVLHPAEGSQVRGVVEFLQKENYVEIRGEVTGLKPGLHGFHVHEYGDCSDPKANCAGAHFNPTNKPHGAPDSTERHVGDLGNIEADASGKAIIHMRDRLISLNGPHSIVGRGLIVHADPDDFKTQPTGNAGARLACGVIGIAGPPQHQ
jgi:Cu-Zn family superoxide dismutase